MSEMHFSDLGAAVSLPFSISQADLLHHAGEYAVSSDGRLIGFHKSSAEALEEALKEGLLDNFSITRIGAEA
ncbi:MAG: hypothetical protein AAF668_01360 [Pseudomonadota bacterium]